MVLLLSDDVYAEACSPTASRFPGQSRRSVAFADVIPAIINVSTNPNGFFNFLTSAFGQGQYNKLTPYPYPSLPKPRRFIGGPCFITGNFCIIAGRPVNKGSGMLQMSRAKRRVIRSHDEAPYSGSRDGKSCTRQFTSFRLMIWPCCTLGPNKRERSLCHVPLPTRKAAISGLRAFVCWAPCMRSLLDFRERACLGALRISRCRDKRPACQTSAAR